MKHLGWLGFVNPVNSCQLEVRPRFIDQRG